MGLDIVSHSKIKKVTDPERIEEHDYDFQVEKGKDPFGYNIDMEDGYYTGDGKESHFRAGSYSCYNRFRNLLCNAIHSVNDRCFWEKFDDKYSESSFAEIINFSDCEGFLGPKVSKKLHEDFVNNREKFISYINDTSMGDDFYKSHYIEVYDNFTVGFKNASIEGVLMFR